MGSGLSIGSKVFGNGWKVRCRCEDQRGLKRDRGVSLLVVQMDRFGSGGSIVGIEHYSRKESRAGGAWQAGWAE